MPRSRFGGHGLFCLQLISYLRQTNSRLVILEPVLQEILARYSDLVSLSAKKASDAWTTLQHDAMTTKKELPKFQIENELSIFRARILDRAAGFSLIHYSDYSSISVEEVFRRGVFRKVNGGPMSKQQLTAQLAGTIKEVRTGESLQIRTDAAEHLADLTRRIAPQRVNDSTLSEIVSLLDSDEDPVRFWVAAALGDLGPRAKPAVPKLLALLPEADCLTGSVTSSPAIRVALKKIGVTPPATKCRDSEGNPYPRNR